MSHVATQHGRLTSLCSAYICAPSSRPPRPGNPISTQDPSKMIKNFENFQKIGQQNVDAAMKAIGEWNKSWQAIAAEVTDYTKRSFEEGTATVEKLFAAKSFEQAVEIQTGYAKRAYDDYMHQVSKIGGLYAELAKEAYKPVEKALQTARQH